MQVPLFTGILLLIHDLALAKGNITAEHSRHMYACMLVARIGYPPSHARVSIDILTFFLLPLLQTLSLPDDWTDVTAALVFRSLFVRRFMLSPHHFASFNNSCTPHTIVHTTP